MLNVTCKIKNGLIIVFCPTQGSDLSEVAVNVHLPMWLYFKFEVHVINVSKFQEFKNIEILSNKLSVIMTEVTCTCFYLCGTLEC